MNNKSPHTEYVEQWQAVKLSSAARARIESELLAHVQFHTASAGVRVDASRRSIKQVPMRTLLFTHLRKWNIMPMTIAILIALMIGGGTTFAAQGALPGDFLYPVKVEVNDNIRSAFAIGADAEAELQADLLAERVIEAETLQARGELDTEQSIAIATRITAQTNEVNEANENSSIEVAATTRAQVALTLQQYNALMKNNGSLLIDIESEVQGDTTVDDTIDSPTRGEIKPTSEIDCNRVPVSTGPESIAWQAECGSTVDAKVKLDIISDTGIRLDEIVFDCDNPPSTMGPESIEWNAQCGTAVDTPKVDSSASTESSVNLSL